MTMTPTPAAPSGELPDDYERWDSVREAVSDFRKATYEFAQGRDPADHEAMMAAQRRIFAEARALAAPSGAPKQPQNISHILALLVQYHQEVWDVAQSDQPIYDEAGRETAKKLVAAIEALAAASTVQSAPVLPAEVVLQARSPEGDPWVEVTADQFYKAQANGYETRALHVQSTPVQVEGQQDSQAHVMPPFAAPANQHDARDPNWLLSTMDGKDWADEFCRMNNAADHGMMLGWFCNAIMTGYDTGRRHEVDEQSSMAGAAKGGIDEPNGTVQAVALPVAAAPEQKP